MFSLKKIYPITTLEQEFNIIKQVYKKQKNGLKFLKYLKFYTVASNLYCAWVSILKGADSIKHIWKFYTWLAKTPV